MGYLPSCEVTQAPLLSPAHRLFLPKFCGILIWTVICLSWDGLVSVPSIFSAARIRPGPVTTCWAQGERWKYEAHIILQGLYFKFFLELDQTFDAGLSQGPCECCTLMLKP